MAYRDCPHTPGIMCDTKSSCGRRGWFPKEDERRKKMIDDGKLRKNLWGVSRLWVNKKAK